MIYPHLDWCHLLNEMAFKTGASCIVKMQGKMSGIYKEHNFLPRTTSLCLDIFIWLLGPVACQEEVCVSGEWGQGVLSFLQCTHSSADGIWLCLCVEIAKQNSRLNMGVLNMFI